MQVGIADLAQRFAVDLPPLTAADQGEAAS
jgi:hypothetical protein